MCERVSVDVYSVVLAVDFFYSTNVLLLDYYGYCVSPLQTDCAKCLCRSYYTVSTFSLLTSQRPSPVNCQFNPTTYQERKPQPPPAAYPSTGQQGFHCYNQLIPYSIIQADHPSHHFTQQPSPRCPTQWIIPY